MSQELNPQEPTPFERIAIVGLGYIGLPTAAVIAARGVPVLGIDVKAEVVDTINRGAIHIVEPDLDTMVREAVAAGTLKASQTPAPADAFIIAVPTPIHADHSADISAVLAAARGIAPVLKKGDLVLIESTSPVGTTDKVAALLASERPDLVFPQHTDGVADIAMAYCPERVLPGQIVVELEQNDRVIGGMTPACAARARALYGLFVKGECIETTARAAELCKLSENAFRDVNIAFANELANVCDTLDIDVWDVIRLANRHPRVNILNPGPGVGGHCIAVDPWFIADAAPDDTPLIRAARSVNDGRPGRVLSAICDAVGRAQGTDKSVARPVVACLGLAFKANVDDVRESPALEIVTRLAEENVAQVLAVEPHLDTLPARLIGLGVEQASLDTALAQADVIVLLVDHAAFKAVPAEALRSREIIDTRGIFGAAARPVRGRGRAPAVQAAR